jgi:regulator of cell morphogenesis and NO signaling
MTAATETVCEIALESPAAIGVFEQFGINYCCGGREPLAEACAANGLDVEIVLAGLNTASQHQDSADRNWAEEPLAALIEHIVATHHAFCKAELPRLSGLAAQVVNQHGGSNPELPQIQSKLAQLAKELAEHLAEEEVSVFPMIVKLEQEKSDCKPGKDEFSVSVGNPLSFLTREHY